MTARGDGVGGTRVALLIADTGRAERIAAAIDTQSDLLRVNLADAPDILVSDRLDGRENGAPGQARTILLGDLAEGSLPVSAKAVLPKDLDPQQLIAAIRLVSAGLTVLPAAALDHGDAEIGDNDREAPARAIRLTARESEVLQLLAAGASNKAIARSLGISVHTVKFHIASILAKLGASSRLEAVGIGLRTGLVMV